MGMSKLSIWVRDTEHPCLPYQSTGHSYFVMILTCDLQPLNFGPVNNGWFALTEKGPKGGRVHGQVEVPPGCYIVIGFATCKNVTTQMAMVQAPCNQEACVNLLPTKVQTCVNGLIMALKIAQILGPNFKPSSPARDLPKQVVSNTQKSLEELLQHLPEDPFKKVFPSDEKLKELIKMGGEEEQKQGK